MYTVTKKFSFCAAHRLPQLLSNHKCSKVHGHNYDLIVTLYSEKLDKDDFVIDFGELKQLQKWINKNFDHAILVYEKDQILSKIVDQFPEVFKVKRLKFVPTSENLAKYFAEFIYGKYCNDIPLSAVKVELYESKNNSASYIYSR